jgi:hypothetical protein
LGEVAAQMTGMQVGSFICIQFHCCISSKTEAGFQNQLGEVAAQMTGMQVRYTYLYTAALLHFKLN